jgi:hypothetical protein
MKIKIVYFVVCCSLFPLLSFSQVFRVGTGFGLGGGKNSGAINLNIIEAAYAPMPALEVGGYFGAAAKVRARIVESKASAGLRYGLQGKYYFKEEGFKPFAGLQVGVLNGFSGSVNTIGMSSDSNVGKKLEIVPMIGFRASAFTLSMVYQQGIRVNLGLLFGFGAFD